MKCANCEQNAGPDAIRITRGGSALDLVAEICETCVKDVKTLKIVLSRTKPSEELSFEGLLPAATFKPEGNLEKTAKPAKT